MTVASETSRALYAGDGTTDEFPIPFRFLENTHVRAVLRGAGGAETEWIEGTHYTLAGAGDAAGGTLTAEAAHIPASGEKLLVIRDLPLTQETDYPLGGAFPAAAHEDALDKLTMIDQQLKESIGRTVTFPATDPEGLNTELPNATQRAGQYLAFDDDGAAIAVAAPEGGNLVTTYMATLLDDDDAATARATLGLGFGQGIEDDGAGGFRVKLDGGTLARSASGVKVADGAIAATQLASSAVTTAKIADGAVTASKLAAGLASPVKVHGWFDGAAGTPSVAGGLNVSSITDHGTGDYSINFSIAFANANYAAVIIASQAGSSAVEEHSAQIQSKTVSAVRIYTKYDSGAASPLIDSDHVEFVLLGDQ